MRIIGSKKGVGTIITTMIILSFVAMIGVAGLSFYTTKTGSFKQLTSSTFSNISNKLQESLILENVAYHNSTQSFNVTLTNTGYITVNIVKAQIQGVSGAVSSQVCTIFPSQSCTMGISYHSFTDPVTITVTTSRNTTLTTTVVPVTSWYNSQWQFRKEITMNTPKIAGTFTNFPVLISITDPQLKTYAQSNGNDILFTSWDGKTKLNHEIENYTSSTGALIAWVQIPTLYNTTNDVIYMYYGNTAAGDQQNPPHTWDNTYGGVWHFDLKPTGTIQIDNSQSTNGTANSQHQITINNFSIGNGRGRELVVGVETANTTNAISSITYGGQSLTSLAGASSHTNFDTEFWNYTNPTNGTANIVVTFKGNTAYAVIGAYSLFGVDQQTPFPNRKTNTGSGFVSSISLTTSYANSLVLDAPAITGKDTFSNVGSFCGSPQTQDWNIQGNYHGYRVTGASSYITKTIAGSTSFCWLNSGSSDPWDEVAIEVKGAPKVYDSTSNQNDLTPNSMTSSNHISGPISHALKFDGSSQYLSRTSSIAGMPKVQGPLTGSIWFWTPTTSRGSSTQDMYTLEANGSPGQQMGFKSIASNTYDTWAFGGNIETTTSFAPFTLGTWHYGVYTYDGSIHRLYVDGVQRSACIGTCNVQSGSFSQIFVGTYDCLSCELYNGTLSEFRVSSIPHSSSWISTEYSNQANPSLFYNIGVQQNETSPRTSN